MKTFNGTPTASPPSNYPTPTSFPPPIPLKSTQSLGSHGCNQTLRNDSVWVDEIQPDDVHFQAASYFASSPGNDIAVSSPCSWDSEFGQVYVLFIFGEAARIADEKWFSKSPLKRCHWRQARFGV